MHERLPAFTLPALGLVAVVSVIGMLGETQVANIGLAVAIAIALLSLNVLLGHTGQISLGQAAFVGTGGYVAINIGGRGLPMLFAVLGAGLVVAALTAFVGMPSLRIRGLSVAIATLVYGIAAQNFLHKQGWLDGSSAGLTVTVPFGRGPTFRLFLFSVLVLVVVLLLDRQLLGTKMGRALQAVRDGEDRAVAFGVVPGPTKLRAYALSGFMAGLAGGLVAYNSGTIVSDEYGVFLSLELLAIAVVGGAGSRGGVLAAAMLLVGVPTLFPPPENLASFVPMVGGVLLIVTVMFLPEGLGGLGRRLGGYWPRLPKAAQAGVFGGGILLTLVIVVREQGFRGDDAPTWPLLLAIVAVLAWAAAAAPRLIGATPAADDQDVEGALATGESARQRARDAAHHAHALRQVPRDLSLRMPTRVLFEATNVSVRFGGVKALHEISLEVREGEIVGLIGANGAGKSTFYNVVSGFVTPEPGSSLRYRGRELLDAPPSYRTRFGIARTFQHMGLMRPLTVRDNVLLAQHWLARYPDFAGLVRLGGSGFTERQLRDRANKALQIFGLDQYLDRELGSLPYGAMRMVELASAVASGADLLFFDEASAGLAPDEAHGLGDRFLLLRDELDLSLVVIEHHVPLIARTCDYVYCLASGLLLAEGEPASVQSNPDVVAEFLGRSRIGDHDDDTVGADA